jgi:hypothetical protein
VANAEADDVFQTGAQVEGGGTLTDTNGVISGSVTFSHIGNQETHTLRGSSGDVESP